MAKIDINILGNAIGEVAKSISEVTKAISAYMGNANVRRLRKCVRNADKIVNRVRDIGIDDKQLNRFIKVHDKLNN